MNFIFLRHNTTKLGPQRITVKSYDASYPPLLAVLSIEVLTWSENRTFSISNTIEDYAKDGGSGAV